jgi:hypothetical protein
MPVRKCANHYCGNDLLGKREHAQTCSPRCRKILWKMAHNYRLRRASKLPTALPVAVTRGKGLKSRSRKGR